MKKKYKNLNYVFNSNNLLTCYPAKLDVLQLFQTKNCKYSDTLVMKKKNISNEICFFLFRVKNVHAYFKITERQ